jgi:hypothetical protein
VPAAALNRSPARPLPARSLTFLDLGSRLTAARGPRAASDERMQLRPPSEGWPQDVAFGLFNLYRQTDVLEPA